MFYTLVHGGPQKEDCKNPSNGMLPFEELALVAFKGREGR